MYIIIPYNIYIYIYIYIYKCLAYLLYVKFVNGVKMIKLLTGSDVDRIITRIITGNV